MFTNCGSFNEGAVVSGNTDETSIIRCNATAASMKGLWLVETLMRQVAIIRCNTHQVQRHTHLVVVVNGNIDETSIIRCNAHQAQRHTD